MITATETSMTTTAHPATTDRIAVEVLSYAAVECPLGRILVARSAQGVCAVLIGASFYELRADLQERFPEAELVLDPESVGDDLEKVFGFVEQPSRGLELQLDLRGTAFQRRVWEMLRTIPSGVTATYTQVAEWIGAAKSVRAVARAIAANPVALAVPCHRVVRTDGGLGGYRWGLERKRSLLNKEASA